MDLSKLEAAGKAVGAVTVIVGATLGLSSWAFTVVMSRRDAEVEDLREDVEHLKGALHDSSATAVQELHELRDSIVDLRIAVAALRAETAYACACSTPAERPHRSAGASHSTSAIREHFDSPEDASAEYEAAMNRLEEL